MVHLKQRDRPDRFYCLRNRRDGWHGRGDGRLREHGQQPQYYHRIVGYNSRLDTVQAAILSVKLPYLRKWSEKRIEHADRYDREFAGVKGLITPKRMPFSTFHIYNQYTLASPKRDAIMAGLKQAGIGCAIYYPVPFHKQDCFQYLGYTPERFPGVRLAALQTMVEEGKSFRNEKGEHVSAANFDRDAYYFAKGIEGKGVQGYKDDEFYLNQHVFNGEHSYFGSLVSREVTKIVNIGAFKNAGHGVSMATKNLGYGAICNTGRLHAPLFFRVCTEVLAAPAIREKLVLNINDGIRGQYEDGPMMNEKFVYPNHSLYFATDPFALDSVCQAQMTEKRKAMGIKVSDHPRFTDYLRYAEKLGLGVADPARVRHVTLGT